MSKKVDYAERWVGLGWKSAFWLCVIVVLIVSLAPATAQLPTTGWDKTNHLLGFSVLALFGTLAYPKLDLVVLPGLFAYGALIEVLQTFTPDRLGEWADLVADGVGLLVGRMALELLCRLRTSR